MKAFISIISVLLVSIGYSQQSAQLGQYDFIPQSVYANPAIKPLGKTNIGVPVLSGIYSEHNNNWFQPSEFLTTNSSGESILNTEKLLNNIDDFAYLNQAFIAELIHVGVRFGENGKHYAHLRVAERSHSGVSLPKDLFRLAIYGNAGAYDFENNTADLSGLAVDAIHFREYALGYNIDYNEKVSIGITAKYLYGMEHVQTSESSLRLRTDPNTYEIQSSGSLVMETAGIHGLIDDENESIHSNIESYTTGLDNHGFGLDLGLIVKPLEKLEIQAAAIDIGFINWKSDVATYKSGNGSFEFSGMDFTEFIFESGSAFDDALENEADSISNLLEDTYDVTTTHNSFKSNLNGFMRYGASYDLFEKNKLKGSVWANFIHRLGDHNMLSTFALGYKQEVGKVLQLGVHFTKRSESQGAFGAGLAINAGPIQVYCLADNFRFASYSKLTIVNDDGERTTVFYPNRPDDIRISFGLNLVFGRE